MTAFLSHLEHADAAISCHYARCRALLAKSPSRTPVSLSDMGLETVAG